MIRACVCVVRIRLSVRAYADGLLAVGIVTAISSPEFNGLEEEIKACRVVE